MDMLQLGVGRQLQESGGAVTEDANMAGWWGQDQVDCTDSVMSLENWISLSCWPSSDTAWQLLEAPLI